MAIIIKKIRHPMLLFHWPYSRQTCVRWFPFVFFFHLFKTELLLVRCPSCQNNVKKLRELIETTENHQLASFILALLLREVLPLCWLPDASTAKTLIIGNKINL